MSEEKGSMEKETGISKIIDSGSEKNVYSPCRVVELFGHVILVEGYDLPNFDGCHALITLRDPPANIVAVLTSNHKLQTLLENALSRGYLIAFWGLKLTNPPTPRGGTWAVDVYGIDGIILYNFP